MDWITAVIKKKKVVIQSITHLTTNVPMSDCDTNALLASQVENVQLSGEVELCMGTSPNIYLDGVQEILPACRKPDTMGL